MKRLLICSAVLIAAAAALQAQPKAPASPPATESVTIGGKAVTITYSSPRVNGRAGHLFGPGGRMSTDPHYPVWRAGANSATTLKTEGDLDIAGLHVPAGTYTLFVDISDPDNWKLIVNKQTGEWGLKYDGSQDLGQTKMTMSTPPAMVENLKYTLVDNGGGKGSITLAWENHAGSVSIAAK